VLGGVSAAALTIAVGASPAQAGTKPSWPTQFPLPDGFLPEGITIGAKPYAYMGSRANGAIYRTDLRTGKGRIVHEGTPGTAAIGLKLDHDGLLYVAGGDGGTGRVINAYTGELLHTYRLTTASSTFVNDVVLTGDRAWFTDSVNGFLYSVPRDGRGRVRRLPLAGDWEQLPNATNSNGIVATQDGRSVIVVNTTSGTLHRISLKTGTAERITLEGGAESVVNGDGLVRIGRTLYVVQNHSNLISVWELSRDTRRARLRRTIKDPRFDVPTTAARYGNRLYLVNARFTSPQLPETTFTGVAVPL
jgi:sugar lactone lactonase YvrE